MKHLKRALLGLAILAGLGVLIVFIHSRQLQSATERARAELKKAGAVTELSQALPPVPAADKDGTEIVRRAAEWLRTNRDEFLETNDFAGMKMVARGKAMISWQEPDLRSRDGTNTWNELEAAIARDQPIFDLLDQLPDHPEFNFQFPYELGMAYSTNFTKFHLTELKRSSRYLAQAILVDLHQGDTAAAIHHEEAMLTLVQAAQSQRFIISYLVGDAILSISEASLWDILQSPNPTDIKLADLQKQLERVNLPKSYADAFNMERLCLEISLKESRRSNAELRKLVPLQSGSLEIMNGDFELPEVFTTAKNNLDMFSWRHWWSFTDESRFVKGSCILLGSLQHAETNSNYRDATILEQTGLAIIGLTNRMDEYAIPLDGDDLHSFLSSALTFYEYGFQRMAMGSAAKQIAITAIALKRYQLKHGQYPDQLVGLVPDFLSAVPIDPMSGTPLIYKRQSKDTFLLYSIGENGVDDGGDASIPPGTDDSSFYWLNDHAQDWVWPQVATPAEVQNFRAGVISK